jgi:hypothetical protein
LFKIDSSLFESPDLPGLFPGLSRMENFATRTVLNKHSGDTLGS